MLEQPPDDELMPWLQTTDKQFTLYDHERKIWGFRVLHMTGDHHGMRSSVSYPRFWTGVVWAKRVVYLSLLLALLVWLGIL